MAHKEREIGPDRRLRVVAAHPNNELYGSDRMYMESLEGLRQAGAEVRAYLPSPGGLSRELVSRGFDVQEIDFPVLRKVDLKGRGKVAFVVATVRRLPRLMAICRQSDAVYVSTIVAPIWVAAAVLSRVPVVVHVHENEEQMERWKKALLLAPVRACSAVIANSRSTERWIGSFAGRRSTVVYNGVADVFGVPSRRSYRTTPRVLVVGRLSERKGQDVAIKAIGALKSRGITAKLVLVGDTYPGYESWVNQLKSLATELGIPADVEFLGWQVNTTPFYQAADVVLVPSRVEPFGNVAVEAMLAGKPVVVTDVQGLREIVRDNVTGRIVPAGDPRALADALQQVLERPDVALRMSAAARRDACERFSVETYRRAVAAIVLATQPLPWNARPSPRSNG